MKIIRGQIFREKFLEGDRKDEFFKADLNRQLPDTGKAQEYLIVPGTYHPSGRL